MYQSNNEEFPKIRNSTELMNGIYKTYDKQIMPTLPNYLNSESYPRPISKGTYLKKEYNERNELLLEIRNQNIGLKYMLQQSREQYEMEKNLFKQEMKLMRDQLHNNSQKLIYNTSQLEEVKVQLRALQRPRLVKKQSYWKKAVSAFIYMFRFYKYSLELAWNRAYKDRMLRVKEQNFEQEIKDIRKWIFGIQKEFFTEMMTNINRNMDFFTYEYIEGNKYIVYKEDEYFQFFLKLFLKTLINKVTEIKEIHLHIQEILYSYIREGVYFKKNFLSTFEINRLKFNFFGETEDTTMSSRAMLLALLIISKSFIHSGIFKNEFNDDVFDEYLVTNSQKKFLKIFGSLLHFITREAFRMKPVMLRTRVNLFNYYRNYQIYNADLEEPITDFVTDLNYSDIDEYYHDMIDEGLTFAYFRRFRKFKR